MRNETSMELASLELHPAYKPVESGWRRLARVVRWREWGSGKQGLIHAFAWLRLSLDRSTPTFPAVMALCLSAAAVMWAYLINAMTDREEDRAAGKVQPFSDLAPLWRWTIALGLPVGLVLLWDVSDLSTSQGLGLGGILAAGFLYSCTPLRAKKHRFWGPILAAAGQRNCALLLATGWKPWEGWLQATAHLLCFLIGLRWICVHQLQDYLADLRGSVSTTATVLGNHVLRRGVVVVFWLEKASLLGVVVSAGMVESGVWYVAAAWLFLHLPLRRFWKSWPASGRLYLTAFAPFHDLYHAVAPVVLAWYLLSSRPEFLLIALVETLLAIKYFRYFLDLYHAAGLVSFAWLRHVMRREGAAQ